MADTTISIIEQMRALKEQQDALQRKLDFLNSLPDNHRLAHELHEELCHADHMEMCDYYRNSKFDTSVKERWVEKADHLLSLDSDVAKILLITKIIK